LQRNDDHRRDQRPGDRRVVVVHEHRPRPRQEGADRDHRDHQSDRCQGVART
jgi:hypothetical protein